MKKLIMLSAIIASGLISKSADAQVRFGVDIHLGARPVYVAPAPVYADQYYYLPDVGAYYSVTENCYYYNDGGNWVSAAYLPGAYRNYDWQHSRRFAVNEPRPYLHNQTYVSRYGGYEHRDWANRDGRDNRMYADRERFDNRQPERRDDARGFEQRDNHQAYGRQPQRDDRGSFDNRNQQPQQNFNRGGQQQPAPQQPQQPAPQQNNGRGQQQQPAPAQNNNHNGGNNGRPHFS